MDGSDLPSDRALGVNWFLTEDKLGFSIAKDLENSENVKWTKRMFFSYMASVYDPIGICSPVIVPAKILFQKCCALKLDWDAELPNELQNAWKTWLLDIQKLSDYKIPRSLTDENVIPMNCTHFVTAAKLLMALSVI